MINNNNNNEYNILNEGISSNGDNGELNTSNNEIVDYPSDFPYVDILKKKGFNTLTELYEMIINFENIDKNILMECDDFETDDIALILLYILKNKNSLNPNFDDCDLENIILFAITCGLSGYEIDILINIAYLDDIELINIDILAKDIGIVRKTIDTLKTKQRKDDRYMSDHKDKNEKIIKMSESKYNKLIELYSEINDILKNDIIVVEDNNKFEHLDNDIIDIFDKNNIEINDVYKYLKSLDDKELEILFPSEKSKSVIDNMLFDNMNSNDFMYITGVNINHIKDIFKISCIYYINKDFIKFSEDFIPIASLDLKFSTVTKLLDHGIFSLKDIEKLLINEECINALDIISGSDNKRLSEIIKYNKELFNGIGNMQFSYAMIVLNDKNDFDEHIISNAKKCLERLKKESYMNDLDLS